MRPYTLLIVVELFSTRLNYKGARHAPLQIADR
jgi:hypothetical protein